MDNYHVISTSDGWKLHMQNSDETLLGAPTKARLLELLPEFMDGRPGSVQMTGRNHPSARSRARRRQLDFTGGMKSTYLNSGNL